MGCFGQVRGFEHGCLELHGGAPVCIGNGLDLNALAIPRHAVWDGCKILKHQKDGWKPTNDQIIYQHLSTAAAFLPSTVFKCWGNHIIDQFSDPQWLDITKQNTQLLIFLEHQLTKGLFIGNSLFCRPVFLAQRFGRDCRNLGWSFHEDPSNGDVRLSLMRHSHVPVSINGGVPQNRWFIEEHPIYGNPPSTLNWLFGGVRRNQPEWRTLSTMQVHDNGSWTYKCGATYIEAKPNIHLFSACICTMHIMCMYIYIHTYLYIYIHIYVYIYIYISMYIYIYIYVYIHMQFMYVC